MRVVILSNISNKTCSEEQEQAILDNLYTYEETDTMFIALFHTSQGSCLPDKLKRFFENMPYAYCSEENNAKIDYSINYGIIRRIKKDLKGNLESYHIAAIDDDDFVAEIIKALNKLIEGKSQSSNTVCRFIEETGLDIQDDDTIEKMKIFFESLESQLKENKSILYLDKYIEQER